ncbi:MAG: hypothetical protein VYE15_01635 [Myxococcota bacterium]|nr:hypothetical protein [Myxococcota bacterium]
MYPIELKSVRIPLALLALGLFTLPASPSQAASATEVVDSFANDEAFGGGYASAQWGMTFHRGPILREFLCLAHDTAAGGGATLCPSGSTILDARELWMERQVMFTNIDLTVGFWRHASLSLHLPLIISDTTELRYDNSVNSGNSSVDPYNQPSLFAVPNQGAVRAGLGDPSLWLRFNPISWARDNTRPTWALDLGVTIPTPMVKEANNTLVGEGLVKLDLATAVSARPAAWIEPYFRSGVTLPIRAGKTLFQDYNGATQTLVIPGATIEGRIGMELIPWELRDDSRHFTVDVGGRVAFTFEGREYTGLFDALGNSDCDPSNAENSCDLTTYDRDANEPASQRRKTDGITDVDQYATLGTWLRLRYRPVRGFQLALGVTGDFEMPHFLTFADAGSDLDEQNAVELENEKGINEYNPVYADGIDYPGNRFRSGGIWSVGFTVDAQWRF